MRSRPPLCGDAAASRAAPCDHVQRTHPPRARPACLHFPTPDQDELPGAPAGTWVWLVQPSKTTGSRPRSRWGFGDQLDSHDFPARDRESEKRRAAARSPHQPPRRHSRAPVVRPGRAPRRCRPRRLHRDRWGRTVTLIASGCPVIMGLARAVRTLTSKGSLHIYRANH